MSEIARPPRSTIAIATSAHEIRSPTESSMSSSRACGVGETLVREVDELVGRVPHRRDDGDDLAARRAVPRRGGCATRFSLSGSPTEVPPNFITTRPGVRGRVLDGRNCFELGHGHLRQCRQPMRPGHWTLRQYVMVVFGAIGVGLLPWTIWLSSSLKPHHATRALGRRLGGIRQRRSPLRSC